MNDSRVTDVPISQADGYASFIFESNLGFSFEHPFDWQGRENNLTAVLKSLDGVNTIEIALESRQGGVSIDDYLQEQTQKYSYGKLIKNGFIDIASFDKSFARRWNDGGVVKSDFFLFRGGKVVRILIYPSSSETEKVFDQITTTLKIE